MDIFAPAEQNVGKIKPKTFRPAGALESNNNLFLPTFRPSGAIH